MLLVALAVIPSRAPQREGALAAAIQPSLSVEVTRLEPRLVHARLAANGDIVAWQEVGIGTEIGGLRLVRVAVDVGDRVRRGDVLAEHAAQIVEARLAASRAALAEAEATLEEASANAARARSQQAAGSLSDQQIQQYQTAEKVARARLAAARAQLEEQRLHLAQARIVAPDDGVIAARAASVGAVTSAGAELFRLIRQGRLEWRAEVAAADLQRLQPGLATTVNLPGGRVVQGRVRALSPLVDAATRNGVAYVELPAEDAARAGMFVRGEFDLGTRQAMTLPRTAVQVRDGFSYVHRVADDGTVHETRVVPGQYAADRVEIVSGLDPADRVVAAGGAFLGDGDRVRVIADGHGADLSLVAPAGDAVDPAPAAAAR